MRDTIIQTTTIPVSELGVHNAITNLLGGLVLAGILTTDTRNALMALADVNQSWAEMEGVGEVTTRDIGIARGSI